MTCHRPESNQFARTVLLVAAAMIALSATAAAAQLTIADVTIPEVLVASVRAPLARDRELLRERQSAYTAAAREFNRRCAQVDEGSLAAAQCSQDQRALSEEAEKIRALKHHLELRVSIEMELALRDQKIAHLHTFREGLARLLRPDALDDSWRTDLHDWARSSEAAQVAALTACLHLLLGTAGPLEEGIRLHEENGARLFDAYRQNRPRLEAAHQRLRAAVRARRGVAGARDAWATLETIDQGLVALLRGEEDAAKLLRGIREVAEAAERASTVLEVAEAPLDAVAKRDVREALSRAGEGLSQIVLDAASDAMLDRLALTRASIANSLRLARFGLEYGLAAFQFGSAWWNIDAINDRIDDRDAARTLLRQRMEDAVKRLSELAVEHALLERARSESAPEMEHALAEAKAGRSK